MIYRPVRSSRGRTKRAEIGRLTLVAALGIVLVAGWGRFAGDGLPARASPPAVPSIAFKAAPDQPRLPSAKLTITALSRVTKVPPAFLGVSTEYWTLPAWQHHLPLLSRVLALVRGQGGPLVLRIGGDSADHAFWSTVHEPPEWVFELTPPWLREVRSLVQRTGVRVILDLNLVTASPATAARWARTAEAHLPRGSIVAFEVGNEPDIYSHAFWQDVTAAGHGTRNLPTGMSASSYTRDFAAYAAALSSAAPGVPLLGPALAGPAHHLNWVSGLLAHPHPGLRAITVHRYPYSACAGPRSRAYPTIPRVLSEQATAGMARTIRATRALAAGAGLPLRLTELNSVTCGGTQGVSNTFATALWAPDALFELLRAGVASADVHVRANAINQAFALTRHGLVARPLLYGLILFVRTLGVDPHLVHLHLQARRSLHLKAWAVHVRGNALHVLIIDKGRRSLHLSLHIPGIGPAVVQRLLAPSAGARANVTLAGQQLSPQGRWHRRPVTDAITPGRHGYRLTIARQSAALVTVHLAPPTHPSAT